MVYLEPGEYLRFGLADDTPDALPAQASALIDAYCRRASLGVAAYVERLRVARDGRTVRLSYGRGPGVDDGVPVVAVTACRVRLRRLRPGMAMSALQADAMLLGLGGVWSEVDPTLLTVSADGEIELPCGIFAVPADEAEVTYTAGFDTVPDAVKLACAQLVRNAGTTPGLLVKRQSVDALAMEYFGSSLLDDDVRRMLQPYCATRLG